MRIGKQHCGNLESGQGGDGTERAYYSDPHDVVHSLDHFIHSASAEN